VPISSTLSRSAGFGFQVSGFGFEILVRARARIDA